MAQHIAENQTLFDYFEVIITYNRLINAKPLWAMTLNKAEWLLFLNLYEMNFRDCKSIISFVSKERHIAKYGDLTVLWCGSEHGNLEYINSITYYQQEINNLTSRSGLSGEQSSGRNQTGTIPSWAIRNVPIMQGTIEAAVAEAQF